MKVLQINSVCGVGSTGKIAVDLYKVLEEEGHECIIAYGRGDAPVGVKSIRIGKNIDNYFHVAKTRVLDKHGFGSQRATEEFIKFIEDYNPDVIHLHNIHGYYINIEILFNYLGKINKKIVWTLHDCWAFTGHCSHFDYIKCNKWQESCGNCVQKYEYPKSFFKDNSEWNYNKKKDLFTRPKNMTIVTPSKWLKSLTEKSFLNKYDIKVINNGIDVSVFKFCESNFRKKHEIEDKIVVLGVTSNWITTKGLDTFVQLSKKLSGNYKVVVVGVTEKQKEALPANIIAITKTTNSTELAKIYSAADVFVNATLEDNYPTTNLEAIACGTPIITYDTGGSGESVFNKCGEITTERNIDSLLECIRKIKLNNKLRVDSYVLGKIDKRNKFKEYIDIYK